MMKKILTVFMIVAIFVGILPYQNTSAYSVDSNCFIEANEARRDRPSGAIDRNGKNITFDYSNLPDQKKSTLICVNDKLLDRDVPVESVSGIKLVPMKALFEAVDATYKWDNKIKAATVKLKGKVIRVQVNSAKATVDGQAVTMEVPARMKWGNVYIPLSFVSKQLDLQFAWQTGSNILRIFTNPEVSVAVASKSQSSDTDDYEYSNFFRVSNRYLLENNGVISLLQDDGDEMKIQQFSLSLVKTGAKVIPTELTDFGGAHVGEDGYYYVIYGQYNSEESNSKPIYRIVKYDNKWVKVAQLDIQDVYVTEPFHASNLTMDSYDGKLVIHSARERYLTGDGLNHQSNITFQIDMKDMKLLYSGGEWPINHVSHSFATYARYDGDRIVYADHGDAYPRAIVLQVEQNSEISNEIEVLKFPGKIGDNYTGAKLGGLEVSNDNYILVGSSVSLTEQYGKSDTSNLFLGLVSKALKEDTNAKVVWLTKHPVKSNVRITETHLVKINDNKFVVLWTESAERKTDLYYAVIDGAGNLLKNPKKLEGVRSPGNMLPLVRGDTVIWYFYDFVYQNSKKQDGIEFYSLQVD
ncbi:copper amine oxidase N-terminal domain-containing protein [Cohnella sp. WQ 127256]|uniref:copper amine oxidase N-terminal domain-containing protein n=1 Tax=Cohnella sp. WQ 127256 TaxID=2938790 RepID=UPI002119A848|nr:copper amine oxidase N-terminal domain-containing protein [Cohnella sp. WQ 127256]